MHFALMFAYIDYLGREASKKWHEEVKDLKVLPPKLLTLNTVGEADVGSFVVLRLAKYDDEIPHIGKVIREDDLNVTIEWWIGSYGSYWTDWKQKNVMVCETFPRNVVIMKCFRTAFSSCEGAKISV